MKIGIVIPDRGDRPELLANCIRMMLAQTMSFEYLVLVDPSLVPVSDTYDITPRYKYGYNALTEIGDCDLIAFIENDDWYDPAYLETMVSEWKKAGQPDLFGTRYTIYYHLKLKKLFTMKHESRASAMNTFIKPGLTFPWSKDNDPFTDCWLWNLPQLSRALCTPDKFISVGIKHGVGKTGGNSHVNNLNRYVQDDINMDWLKLVVDRPSFEFYASLSDKL